jgi:hypothetical protein
LIICLSVTILAQVIINNSLLLSLHSRGLSYNLMPMRLGLDILGRVRSRSPSRRTTMTIWIRRYGCDAFRLDVEATDTIDIVKDKIRNNEGIPHGTLVFLICTATFQRLAGSATLEYYGVRSGYTLAMQCSASSSPSL